jgi:hypothetical protein
MNAAGHRHKGSFMRVALFALATLLLSAPVAAAEKFQIDGQTLSISPPEGYCLLDRSRPDDAGLTALLERSQEGVNRVLQNFALCAELEDWHAGRINNLRHFGNVMVPVENGETKALDMSRSAYVTALAGSVNSVDYTALEREINEKIDLVQISGTQFLGALHQDEQALYIGVLVALETGGKRLPQAGIAILTMLGKIPASMNMQWPAEEGVFDGLLAAQQSYAAALIQANP